MSRRVLRARFSDQFQPLRVAAFVAGSVLAVPFASAQFVVPFEEVGSWAPTNGDAAFDMGGWNGTAIVAADIPGTDDTRTYAVDLSDPANPVVLGETVNFGSPFEGSADCSFFWDAPIEVRDGYVTLVSSLGCTFTGGGQKGFSLDTRVRIDSLPGAAFDVDVVESVADLGFYFGSVGNQYTATGQSFEPIDLQGFGPRAGESGTLDVGFNYDSIRADGDRLYVADGGNLSAYDVSSLGAPMPVYAWNGRVVRIADGLGFDFDFNAADPSLRELLIWDMTPPTGPVLLSETVFDGVPQTGGVDTYGGFVYVNTTTGINIIDVSDPASPVLVASDQSIGSVRGLGFAPGLVYALVDGEVLVLRTMTGSCNPADLAEPFDVLDLADVQAFVQGFVAMDPASDLAAPEGVFDLADLAAFVTSFNAGCP